MSDETEAEDTTWATPRMDKNNNLHYVVPPNAVVDEPSSVKDDKVDPLKSVTTVASESKSDDSGLQPNRIQVKSESEHDLVANRVPSSVKTLPRSPSSGDYKKKASRQISVTLDGDVAFENADDDLIAMDGGLSREERIQAKLHAVVESTAWTCTGAFALGVALFGAALFIIFDIPDDPGVGLQDALMTLATLFFILELVVLSIADRGYWLSAFFFMDLLGTVSMIFEISFLLGRAGKMISTSEAPNTVVMKAARAAKVGARTARLSKVAKCFSFVMRRRNEVKESTMPEYDANVLKNRLAQALAIRVSVLTVVLVVGVPLFDIGRYPEDDFSTRGWSRTLEITYSVAYSSLENNQNIDTTNIFKDTVQEMDEFYDDLNYFPYKLEGYPQQVSVGASRSCTIPGQSLLADDAPSRKQNILQQKAEACRAPISPRCVDGALPSIYFDLKKPNQYEAGMDIALICFIVLCMVAEAFNLSHTIDLIMVKPVERMLGTVQMMAQILNSVQSKGALGDDAEDLTIVSPHSEATSLELVFKKLSDLTVQFMKASMVQEADLHAMDNESKGIILDILQLHKQPEEQQWVVHKVSSEHEVLVPTLPVEEDVIESWELETMNMTIDDLRKVMMFVFYDSKLGRRTGRIWTDPAKFHAFHEVVRAGYLDVPYHTYTHAADVVTCVFRVMLDLQCAEWLSEIDTYALLISALAHDIGHPGRTTPFLVETRHELAVRYNDSSPLENMHCARLFQITGHDETNIFSRLEKDAYKQARKVCITSILHTDNAQHFEMVKCIKKVYELYMDICDAQTADPEALAPSYVDEVLCKDTAIWHKLILHLSDVATPLKPFPISRAWATRVQDEFFSQGDEEKYLGIPVGMLNDRDKVSRSSAEHGFINFLVAPLVFPTIEVFPPLLHLAVQMGHNMQEWRNLWVQDTAPSSEDVKKRDGDISKIQETVDKLTHRKAMPTVRTSQRMLMIPGGEAPMQITHSDSIKPTSSRKGFGPTFSIGSSQQGGMGSAVMRTASVPIRQKAG